MMVLATTQALIVKVLSPVVANDYALAVMIYTYVLQMDQLMPWTM